jgi:hypothetical protein
MKIILILIVIVGVFIIGMSLMNQSFQETPSPQVSACTMDAKVCPDGSYVGRVAPSCEFAPCP